MKIESLFLGIILLFPFHVGHSQWPASEIYTAMSWGMNDGLPQSSVNDVIQTRDGYIWLATFGGLVRFNGESFTVFNRFNATGMVSDRVLWIYEDRDGDLWVSTEDGFLRYHDGIFTIQSGFENAKVSAPLTIAQDGRGVLWISVDAQPYRYFNGVFHQVPVLTDTALARKAVNDSSGIWMAHRKRLLRTFGDSIVLVKDFSSDLRFDIQAFEEFPHESGQYWMATDGDGIVRYSKNRVEKFDESDGLPSKFLKHVYVDRQQNLWVSGFNGISKLSGERFIPLRTNTGLVDQEFSVITQDVEGNYWVGTPADGLHKLRSSILTTIGPLQGLLEEKTLSIMRRRDGSLLIGTNCDGVYQYKDGKAHRLQLNEQLQNLCIWSVFEDSRKRIWVGSRLLYRFNSVDAKGELFDSTKGFYGTDVISMMEDSQGALWIGCLNGLYVYDGKRFRQYDKTMGLTHNEIRSLYEDRHGRIWIGTSRGLHQFFHGAIVPIPLYGYVGDSSIAVKPYIRAIHEDDQGTMWFGTYGAGIIRLQNDRVSILTTHDGLYDNIVSHIMEDERGNFWIGCNSGIFRVKKSELNSVADGEMRTVRYSLYGVAEGMLSAETNGGFQPAAVKDSIGNIYFPTVKGIAVVATRKIEENLIQPPVKIEKIFSGTTAIPVNDTIVLPYEGFNIEIQFAALSFVDPHKTYFKYKLEGSDEQWVDAGTRRRAYYSTIPPGEFTFRVIAANNDGVWNENGASIHFSVPPPYWMTWWFRSLVVVLFLLSGPIIYYIRVSQLKKEQVLNQQFAEQLIDSQEQERRRIASELHDGLGQQILIIKNRAEIAQNSIHQPEKMLEQLREISASAVSSMNDVRSIAHGLRPVHLEQFGLKDTLINLIENVQQSSPIEWTYHVDAIDGFIPKEKEINFYRIIQEGINNILKHSGATQASMMIRCSEEEITASLWDNGKGFAVMEKYTVSGLGLVGIFERAKSLGGICEIKSSPGRGTTIFIILPILTHE